MPSESLPALPPYNPEASCRKCGSTSVRVRFHAAGEYWGCTDRFRANRRDHLHRTCEVCFYDWAEAPIDQEVDHADE